MAPLGSVGETIRRTEEWAFVFTDIQGYSQLFERYRQALSPALERHNHLIRTHTQAHGGREVKVIGDAFFLVFPSAYDAVQFALSIQHALHTEPWTVTMPDGVQVPITLKVRIGVHMGEAEVMEHPNGSLDYIGADVNRAARVASAGHGGQVVLSSATYALVAEANPEFQFRCLGQYWLKGVGRERLWQVWDSDLPSDFPPLRAPRADIHNLALVDSAFVGRERETAELERMLTDPNRSVVTLVGPSGVGKTRLAQAVAESVLDYFEEGVWYLSLEGLTTPETILQRVAQTLPLQAQPELPLESQLLSYLQDRSVLLIFDDIESHEALASVVRTLLRTPRLKVLVVSGMPLHLRMEHLYEVKPLSIPPLRDSHNPTAIAQYGSVQLVLEQARRHKPDFTLTEENAEPIAELCRQLDGLPLALELASSRLALLSPSEILRRLDGRFQILQARNPELPARQRTLQSALEWSYSQLAPETQAFFNQLAIFVDSFALEDAEAVCEADFVLDSLTELREHALLMEEHQKGEPRFRLLNPLRMLALSHLQIQPDLFERVGTRHAHYCLSTATSCLQQIRTAQEQEALRRAELYLRNFESASEWFRSQGKWALGAQMAIALAKLHDRLGNLHLIASCLQSAAECLAQLSEVPAILQADLLLEQAVYAYETHQWETAHALVQQALKYYEGTESIESLAQAHNLAGLIAMRMNQYEQAHTHLEQALRLFESAGLTVWAALIRNNQGLVEYGLGNLELAEQLFTEATVLQRQLRDRRGLSESLTNLGAVRLLRGDLADAFQHYSESLHCEVELGNRVGVARGLCNLGEVFTLQKEVASAVRYLIAAKTLFQQVGSPNNEYACQILSQLPVESSVLQSLAEHARHRTWEDLLYWAQNG